MGVPISAPFLKPKKGIKETFSSLLPSTLSLPAPRFLFTINGLANGIGIAYLLGFSCFALR